MKKWNLKMLNDKRGIFGLDSVKIALGLVGVIALIIYVTIILTGILTDTEVAGRDTFTKQLNNESILIWLDVTRGGNDTSVARLNSITFLTNTVINSSGNVIDPANYTVVGGNFAANDADASGFTNASINVSGQYRYKGEVRTAETGGNISAGIVGFSEELSTIFVVMAILVIVLVLIVLFRITSSRKEGGL